MRLCSVVERKDVEEATRLFEVSTIDSLKADIKTIVDPEKVKTVLEIEDYIRKILPINQKSLIANLEQELENRFKDITTI